MAGSIRGWCYEIQRGACSVCGEVDSVLLGPGSAAICEHCALCAGMAWRRVVGEIPSGFPDEDVARITSVAVLVARRVTLAGVPEDSPPVLGPRQMPTAYEFLTVPSPDGESHVLPSASVSPGVLARDEALRDAALGALESVGLRSWRALCELLHVGYTPRGRLSAVVLVRGYAQAAVPQQGYSNQVQGVWRVWPLSAHAGKLAGYYEFMEAAWPARLYKLCVPDDRLPAEISVSMREAARRYVELQSAAGAGGDVDTSMLAAYRHAMSADECAVAEMVRKSEEEERVRKSEEERARKSRKQLSAMSPEDGGESGGSQSVGDDSGSAAAGPDVVFSGGGDEGDGGGDEAVGGQDDPPPEPGFARSFPRR